MRPQGTFPGCILMHGAVSVCKGTPATSAAPGRLICQAKCSSGVQVAYASDGTQMAEVAFEDDGSPRFLGAYRLVIETVEPPHVDGLGKRTRHSLLASRQR